MEVILNVHSISHYYTHAPGLTLRTNKTQLFYGDHGYSRFGWHVQGTVTPRTNQ